MDRPRGPRIEIHYESGESQILPFSARFADRIRIVVSDTEAGYRDIGDFIYAALRIELDRAEKGLFSPRRRRW
jgi:hypothetical protein